MIHEQNCTYEVAKLAKEKGFPQHIGNDAYIVDNEYDDKWEVGCHYPIQFIPDYLPTIVAPTQSLLQRWLREERGVVVEVIAQPTCSTPKKNCYWWSIKQNSDGLCYQYEECSYILYNDKGYFATYELALEDALKYTFKKLIK
jgi:hypothetical protein